MKKTDEGQHNDEEKPLTQQELPFLQAFSYGDVRRHMHPFNPGSKSWWEICRINGLTSINLTKLDVLSELEVIRLGTAYKLDGEAITAVPATIEALEKVEVIYEDLPGWQEDISKVGQLDKDCTARLTRKPTQFVSP